VLRPSEKYFLFSPAVSWYITVSSLTILLFKQADGRPALRRQCRRGMAMPDAVVRAIARLTLPSLCFFIAAFAALQRRELFGSAVL